MARTVRWALLALLLLAETCRADPVIWLDDNVDLRGRSTLFIAPVNNQTGKKFDVDPVALITSELIQNLRNEGMTVLEKQDAQALISVDSSLIDYEAGSAVQRWLLPGAGATVCVVRSILTDGKSGKVLGEIIVSETVGAGGLFSVGAETSVPKYVAKEIAQALSALIKKK